MRFGEPISDERMEALLRPGSGIDTLITADAYGAGEADTLLGRALAGVPRSDYAIAGAVGHDFYEGEREGAKGFPRFTDPRLRGPEGYRDYLRMAVERIVEALAGDSVLAEGLGISFGLALFPVHGMTPEELIRRADQALYAAKRSDDDLHFAPRAA